jgi:hypothetical protein
MSARDRGAAAQCAVGRRAPTSRIAGKSRYFGGGTCRALRRCMASILPDNSIAPEDLRADRLEHLWEQDRDDKGLVQIIDLELEDLDEWNEIDDRDGRDADDEEWLSAA